MKILQFNTYSFSTSRHLLQDYVENTTLILLFHPKHRSQTLNSKIGQILMET